MCTMLNLLKSFRPAASSEREKGTYFEEQFACYLRHEAIYRDYYSEVWTYAHGAARHGLRTTPIRYCQRCSHNVTLALPSW
jgi:predicted helicase